jgi:hypothetical protein
MKFIADWKSKAMKLWSIRLGLVAALLSGVEVILPLFADAAPRGAFAVASFVTTVAAMIARLVSQPALHKD